MATTMTIGDFSKATRLSAKTLRFYHQVGLLEPARVDPLNGYRGYAPEQISVAQVVRHFRALNMPVERIRDVLAADIGERTELIAAHLTRMEAELETTRSAVAALRALLVPADSPLVVSLRQVGTTPAVVLRDTIDLVDLGPWYDEATHELEEALAISALEAAGTRGGLWSTELFLDERGAVALFRPITALPDGPVSIGRVRAETLPAMDLAVAVHHGSDETLSQVYGALGEYVARHELGIDGPIREVYLQEPSADGYAVTEIGWPIFGTTA